MAGTRRLIELVDQENGVAGAWESIARALARKPAGSVSRRAPGACWPIGKTRLSMRWVKPWECIIRRFRRYIERAKGPMERWPALDERPPPGQRSRTITVEAKTVGGGGWLCRKPKELGLSARGLDDAASGPTTPREAWTEARAWVALSGPGPGHRVQDPRRARGEAAQRCATYLEPPGTRSSRPQMGAGAAVASTGEGVTVLKKAGGPQRTKKKTSRARR